MATSQTWPPQGINPLRKDLDELALAVQNPSDGRSDDEQVWLTRFLVVRTCGFLEQVLHKCVIGHIEAKSAGMSRSFALSWLERSINPSVGNVLTTLGRFDQNLADEFQEMLDDGDGTLNNDLHALVTKRHQIAHGENGGFGTSRALDLYERAIEVADWIILRFQPEPGWGSRFGR